MSCIAVRIFYFMALLLVPEAAAAQSDRDSLKTVAESNMHDSLRMDAILLITDDLYDEEEFKYISMGREIARRNLNTSDNTAATRLRYLEALDRLCVDEAWAHDELYSNAKVALQYSRSCLDQWQSNPNNSLMAQALNNSAVLHYYLGSIDSAMHYQNRAIAMRRLLPDQKSYAQSLINMGYLTFRGGLLGPAMPYFFEAVDILEEVNDREGLLYALRMLGTVYVELDENEKLLELAKRRVALALQHDSYAEVGSAYNALAVAWNGMQYNDSAAYYYEKCVSVIPLLEKNKQGAGFMWLTNYATFLQATDNLEKALATIELAAQMVDASDNFEQIARIADVKALIFNDLLFTDSAIHYGNIVMGEAERTGRWDLLATAGERLQKAYFAKGNFERAYHYQGIARQYNDSLLNRENTRQIERAELMYKFNKQDAESRAQQAQLDAIAAAALQHQRTLKNIGFIIGSLVLLLAFGLYRRYRFKQRVADELEAKNIEIDAARERAERSEAFRKQFLANMSHEIRTPMNAILGMTRLLKDREHDPQSQRYLDAVDHAANNLLVVINDILDLSKLEAGKMEARLHPAPLRRELEMLATTFKHRAAEKGLGFTLHSPSDLPEYVHTDMARVIQVLYNLLGNATKFTEKGLVTLRINHHQLEDDRVRLSFAVSDTGPGIALEEQAHIFESFGQGHIQNTRRFGGTGLGLTIARSLVELLGGELKLDSTSGKGATFSFSITSALSTAEAHHAFLVQHSFQLSERQRSFPLRMLLADDNEYNRLVAVDTLHKYLPCIRIDTAQTGQEVLDMLSQKDYDLVYMDAQMPGMDGYEATKAIRSHSDARIRSIHIVAFTASVVRTDIQRCYDAGMNGYIPKPFRDEDLLRPVATLIDKLPERDAHEPLGGNAKKEVPESRQTLFAKLVPKRLEILEKAIESNDAGAAKRVIHLMKAQLLDAGMHAHSANFEWFEHLDLLHPKSRWKARAEELARAVKEEIKCHI